MKFICLVTKYSLKVYFSYRKQKLPCYYSRLRQYASVTKTYWEYISKCIAYALHHSIEVQRIFILQLLGVVYKKRIASESLLRTDIIKYTDAWRCHNDQA